MRSTIRTMDHVERNAEARGRLSGVVGRLKEADLEMQLGEGWTVAATLAHLAFWDRMVEARWRRGPSGVVPLSEAVVDLINDAAQVEWRMLQPASAAALALTAAEDTDRIIAEAPPDLLALVQDNALMPMLDRWRHRTEHLDEIEAALRK